MCQTVKTIGWLLALVSVRPAFSQPAREPTGTWEQEWLVLERTGRHGRTPIPTDSVTFELARGTLRQPAEGVMVTSADGAERSWKAVRTTEDSGWLRHTALRGGYAALTLALDSPRTVLLDAAGHSVVYCNGVPRCGDPYATGFVRLPLQLRAGRNLLLFRVARGRLRARLLPAPRTAILNGRDVTLPDALIGVDDALLGAIVVVNPTSKPLGTMTIEAQLDGGPSVRTSVPTLQRLTVRKVPFRIASAPELPKGETRLHVRLLDSDTPDAQTLDNVELPFRVRSPSAVCKRTFTSTIDGSTQYYAIRESSTPGPGQALFLSLHGAAVRAEGQAAAYAPKDWGHLVAPTNRRPYGFDWEDWGRWDALEVLEHARAKLEPDSQRIYLTGHSMGGHGTWHLGVTYPDRFAAIGPSAGWISFWSYAGAARPRPNDERAAMFQRAAHASDTLQLVENLHGLGVYVLHGSADDNVPVTQARRMRDVLGGFHPDFSYREEPGGGHWWGNACVDWPEMFAFFQQRRRPALDEIRTVRFRTASPGVSARMDWITVEMQQNPLETSFVEISADPSKRRLTGRTENISRLTVHLEQLGDVRTGGDDEPSGPGAALTIALDGQTLTDVVWPPNGQLRLRREAGNWSVASAIPPGWKGPQRYGPFKQVFRNNVIAVYGTIGNAEENAWAYAKARFDAETFWYRGNGSIELMPDVAYDPERFRDRNVVLYGNADTNAAWPALLAASPVRVSREGVRVGTRSWTGEDLAALFIQPREGHAHALTGVVAGTGRAGMRTTDTLPYFVSGVAYPDCTVLRAQALLEGIDGVVLTGFFDEAWGVVADQLAERPGSE